MNFRLGVVLGFVVGALGVAVATATTSAIAAVPIPDANGIIRACVKYEDINHYEQVRWITATKCPRSSEKLITWNAKGPKGDKGEKGDTGATGAPGKDGAPGINKGYESYELNTAHGLHFEPQEIYSIDVPDGEYAITATVQVENFHDDDVYVACNINHWTGLGERIIRLKGHSAQVMTVMKLTGPSLDDPGKITLICSGLPQSDDLNAAQLEESQIMAVKIE